MEIRMTIPKEFEWHFKMDRFKDSLGRINFDIPPVMYSCLARLNVLSAWNTPPLR